MVVAPQAEAALSYGAIAYAKNGAGASVWNYSSPTPSRPHWITAVTAVRVLSSFKDCGAVVFDGTTLQGGYGRTLSAAISDANHRLPNSYVDSWACNT